MTTEYQELRHYWEDVLRNSLELSQGSTLDPNKEIQKEWYYLTFCKNHRMKYLLAGNDLEQDGIPEVTEFMRVQREADLAAGLLDKISKTQDKKVARKK